MREKGFAPIIIVVLLVLAAIGGIYYYNHQQVKIVPDPTPTPPSADNISKIDNSVVYFSSSDKVVSKYNFSSKITEKVVDAGSYAISKDGQWLAYTSGYDTAEDMVINIKNLKNNQLSSFDSKTALIRRLQWSKSAQYLVSDSGTGPDGWMNIFDRSGKQIASFGTAGLVWAKDDSLLFYSLKQEVNPPRPWGSGFGSGIGLMELPSGKTQVVLAPDATNDYYPFSYENGNLIISRRQAVTPSDWSENQKITETYLTIDSANLQSTPQVTSTPGSVSQNEEIRKKILASGILDLGKMPEYDWSADQNPQDADWILLSIYPGDSVYASDLYILNIQKPMQSLVQIGKGAWPQWR